MNSIAKLIVTLENQNREYLITEKQVSIGRSDENLIMINHPTVSRVHAHIIQNQDKYYIKDMSSFKRTYLNGEKILGEPVELRNNDRLKLGSINARFILDSIMEPDLLFYEKQHQTEERRQFSIPTDQMRRVTEGIEIQNRSEESKRPELRIPESQNTEGIKPQNFAAQQFVAQIAEELPSNDELPANEEADFESDMEPIDFFEEKIQTAKLEEGILPNLDEEKGQTAKMEEKVPPKFSEKNEKTAKVEELVLPEFLEQKLPAASHDDGYEIEEIDETDIQEPTPSPVLDFHEGIEISPHEVSENMGEDIVPSLEAEVLAADPVTSFILQAEEKEALIAQAKNFKSEENEKIQEMIEQEKQEQEAKEESTETPFAEWEMHKLVPEILCVASQKIVELKKEVVSIGTESIADLSLQSPFWEKIEMAVIRNEEGKYFLRKIGKTEIQINGKILENVSPLKDADIIQSAGHTIVFFDSSAAYPAFQRSLKIACKTDKKKSFISPFLEETTRYEVLDGKLSYSFKIFCRDDDYTAFFVKENPYGVYIFLGEIQEKYPNYRMIPWIQGIFDSTVDYLEGCAQILKEMNSHILQTCKYLPLNAMILRVNATEVRYSCASSPCGIYRRNKGAQELLFTKGMSLGLQENYFSEESSISWQPGDSMLLYTTSCLTNTLQENPKKLLKQEDINRYFSEIMQKQGQRKALDSLRQILEDKVTLSHPFVLSLFTLGSVPSVLICPKCGDTYPQGYRFCPKDGASLQEEI